MKTLAVLLSLWAISPAVAQTPAAAQQTSVQSDDRRWEAIFNTETRYFSLQSSRAFTSQFGNSAIAFGPSRSTQVYVPFGLALTGRPSDDLKFNFFVRSGYVWSRQRTSSIAGGISTPIVGEYSGLTDTSFGGTTTYNGWAGFQPFFSLNVNAPTGRTLFLGNATFAKLDSDVVNLPSFGEGWNFGPTIGVNIPITPSLVWSTGVGYTNRGPLDREGPVDLFGTQLVDRLNPGDVLTFNNSIGYRGERVSVSGSVSYSIETTTTLNGQDYYQAGNRIIFAAGFGYAWNSNWASRIIGTFSHFNKNEVRISPLPNLVRELFNTNSNVTNINFDTMYTQGNFSIGPTAGFLYRDHNSYDPTTKQFLPAKIKWSAGGAASYAVSQQASFNARVEHLWLHENENPDKILGVPPPIAGTGVPAITTHAWHVSIGGTFRF